ncbi:MAG TPA: hypothetical protein VEQ11_09475 [Chloroflexota bacterium]|nr:hypothetical protein [Chloroflexota bacterium]
MATDSTEGFPRDDYTPHGYLANPYAFATSWTQGHGGNLRSTREAVGFGWLYPWARDARAGSQLEIAVSYGAESLVTRADFERFGLSAPHHSALLFEYLWRIAGFEFAARFVLVGEHELGLEMEVGRVPPPAPPRRGERERARAVTVYLAAVGWRRDGECVAEAGRDHYVDVGEPFGVHLLCVDAGSEVRWLGASRCLQELAIGSGAGEARGKQVAVGLAISLTPGPSAPRRLFAVLRREQRLGGGDQEQVRAGPGVRGRPSAGPGPPAPGVRAAMENARRRDVQLWRGGLRLEGDWPPHWRRGWVYDVETTRMCLFPAGGVFADVWPAWTIQWPRAVLAEGSLDALRLAYVDPELARRAALSLFRDAPAPNLPCIFQHGQPNMIAADGSMCGTSPAWCVPFFNLELLYLRTLDHDWLGRLYPFLADYLDWWLAERTDAQGWSVYKCTWEAGEDDTPRLDPERRGDNIVSEYVRPVELQAAMALSAAVLARFAAALGRDGDERRWRAIARQFFDRTQALWDAPSGRFRDWDRRADRFLEPTGEPSYWEIDPCRYSALAFTPLLADLATTEQTVALSHELEQCARPPWTLWPSWSYVVLEAALAAGQRAFAARVASEIVERVYTELDARSPAAPSAPTPGVAREYWPLDLAAWNACEGYGWGATTASFVVRQIFGFLDSQIASGLRFRLAPGLPERFLRPGARYALRNVPYRDESLDLEFAVPSPATRGQAQQLEARVGLVNPRACLVVDEQTREVYRSAVESRIHRFVVELGGMYEIELPPSPPSPLSLKALKGRGERSEASRWGWGTA